MEHTSYVITLPDNKRHYVKGYPIYYGRWGHGQAWMGPFTNLPDLARQLRESPDAVKWLIESGDGPLGPGTASKYQLVNGKPAHVGERYRPALYIVIRGCMREEPPVLRTFPTVQETKASVAAAEEDAATELTPDQADLLTLSEDDKDKRLVEVEARRRKSNVEFARYCLKEVLFRYWGLREQVALAANILSAGTLGALREAVERFGRGLDRAISTHYSNPGVHWEAGPAELEAAFAQMRPTLAEWAEAIQSYWNAQEAIRRERGKLRRIPDSSPDKEQLLQALSEKSRVECEREYVVAGERVKGGQLQFAFRTLNTAAASLPDLREQFLKATDWELEAIFRQYHGVLHAHDRERLKLKLIHSIARDFSTWEGVANSAHDLGTREGCLAALADDSISLSGLPFVRKHWGREEVDGVLASSWPEMKRVILGWRARLEEARKGSPGLSATQVQALDLELIGLLKRASGWAYMTLDVTLARETAQAAKDLERGTPQKQFCARAFLAARKGGGGLADFCDASEADLRGVDVRFRRGFRELRGTFHHAKMSNSRFDYRSWATRGHVLFGGSFRHVDFAQALFAAIVLDADFRGANVEGARFHDCRIGPNANFNGVDFSKTRSVPSRERVIRHGTFKGAKLGKLGSKVFADKEQVAGAEISKSASGGVLSGRRFGGMEAFALFNPDRHDSIRFAKRPPSWDKLCFDAADTVVKTRAPIGIYDNSQLEVRGTPESVLGSCSLKGARVLCQGHTLCIRHSDIRGAAIRAPLAQDLIFCPQTTLANPATLLELPKVRRVWVEVEGRPTAAITGPSDVLTMIVIEILHRWNCPLELKELSAKLKDSRSWLAKAVREAWKECEAADATARNPTNAEPPPAAPTVMHPQDWIASLIDPRLAEIRHIPDPEADQAKLIGALPNRPL